MTDYIFIAFSLLEACLIVSYIVWKNVKDNKKPVGTIFLFRPEDGSVFYQIGFKLNNKDYSYDDLAKLKSGTIEITQMEEGDEINGST